MSRIAYTGARIFDGETWWERSALIVADGVIEQIIAADSPTDAERVPMQGGILAPGFIDLQVNGAGGVLLNDAPTPESIATICTTLARFGVTACLPTLISDTPDKNAATIGAARQSLAVPGFLGLHLEGPHLSRGKPGAHDPAMLREMSEADVLALLDARRELPCLLITVAPEAVTPDQVTRLSGAGIVVSIGHTAAGYADIRALVDAGATMVTHLFNAQSQITPREPGLVGAALDIGELHAGIIADGIHVHSANLALARRAKTGPGRLFLVSDAMPVTGTEAQSFTLGDRTVHRRDGALRLDDGTLAGADLTLADAIGFLNRTLGVPVEEALRMASLYPAEAIGVTGERGSLKPGMRADVVHLGDDLAVRGTLIGGETAWAA
jgi:N-acetylglucosamine-6-phosphate deacetylase